MKSMKYDILSVQERADNRRREGHFVINGCAGMLFEDNKSLCIYEGVNRHIERKFRSYLSYPSVLGSSEYKDGVLNWLFQDKKEKILSCFDTPFAVTLGGTGALYMAFSHFSRKRGLLLLPDIRWPNYDTIADQCRLPLKIHRLLTEEGRLNVASIKEAIDASLVDHDEILLVVNDPCQNPIGYCLDETEYDELFDLLSEYPGKVTLLMDVAYVDYCPEGFLFLKELLKRKAVPFDIYICFSASKSFGLYGMRLGALFGLLSKEKDNSSIREEMKRIARGTYSCANNGAMGPVSEFFHDEKAMEEVREKIHSESRRLYTIGNKVSAVLDDLNIRHFPYKGGFYLTFETENPIAFCQNLESKDIYFAPIDSHHVRIAVSGLNMEEIEEFERRMKA